MEIKRNLPMLALVLLLMLPSTVAFGQIAFGQQASGGTGFVYTSWKLSTDTSETKISQFWIPIDAYVPLKDNLEARVFVANGSTNLDQDGNELDISGMGDVSVQFSHSLADDQWLVSAGINLPTGKKKLSLSSERAVLQALAQSFLDFPMRRYGEGLGLNLLVGTARQVGEFMVSGGAIYRYIGSYEPYLGVDDYNPGDNFNINASAETERGSLTMTGSIVFASYQADQSAGQKVFKQGNHISFGAGCRISNDNSAYGGQISYRVRSRNSWYEGTTETVIQRLKLYGNELDISLNAALKINESWQIRPIASYRLIEENELDIGSSNILTIGATGATNLSDKFALQLGLKYHTGQAIDNLYDLSGLQITTGLTASF